MAITKIWNIQPSMWGTMASSLRRSLFYIANFAKTENGMLVGGVNCLPDAEAAYEQMVYTKQMEGKELGRQGYHVVIAFPKGECDANTCYQITEEFIHEFLGNRYEALFAVHNDKDHIHSHIIFNSCNMIDGYKYEYKKGDWKYVIQPITNRLCEKYHQSIMPAEYSKHPKNMSRAEYERQTSYKDTILADAEYCLSNAKSKDDFIWLMKKLGYEVKDGKHIAVRIADMKKFRRLDVLDPEFAQDKIEATIEKLHKVDVQIPVKTFNPVNYRGLAKTEYQRKFYIKMQRLRLIEKNRFSTHAALYYKDIKRMHQLQQQYLYLVRNDIKSAEELIEHDLLLKQELKSISDKQKVIYDENAKAKYDSAKSEKFMEAYNLIHDNNSYILADLKAEKKSCKENIKMVQDIAVEAMYNSLLRIEWNSDNEDLSEISTRPEIPESPEARAERELREKEEQARLSKIRKDAAERKAKQEAADNARREAQRKELERLDAYSNRSSVKNHYFNEVYDLPYNTPWKQEYLEYITSLNRYDLKTATIEELQEQILTFADFSNQKEAEKAEDECQRRGLYLTVKNEIFTLYNTESEKPKGESVPEYTQYLLNCWKTVPENGSIEVLNKCREVESLIEWVDRTDREHEKMQLIEFNSAYNSWIEKLDQLIVETEGLDQNLYNKKWEYEDYLMNLRYTNKKKLSVFSLQAPVQTYEEFASSMDREEQNRVAEERIERQKAEQIQLQKQEDILKAQERAAEKLEQAIISQADKIIAILRADGITDADFIEKSPELLTVIADSMNMEREQFVSVFLKVAESYHCKYSTTELSIMAYEIYDLKEEYQKQMTNKDEVVEIQELPDSYKEFDKLSIREKAELLCKTPADADSIHDILIQYAEDVGYHFDYFGEFFDVGTAIGREAKQMFLEKEASAIVRELRDTGVTAENFKNISTNSFDEIFEYLSSDGDNLFNVFKEVARQMNVNLSYEELSDIVICISDNYRKQCNHRTFRISK